MRYNVKADGTTLPACHLTNFVLNPLLRKDQLSLHVNEVGIC